VRDRLAGFSLEQMEAFVSVIDYGSFSAAARARQQAQPGISGLVQKLEERIGYALFDRTGYRPQLTSEGRALLPYARRLTREALVTSSVARSISELDEQLSVSVETAFPIGIVTGALARLQNEHASLRVRIYGDSLDGVADRIASRECEIGIANAFAKLPSDINRMAIDSIRFQFVAAAGHPLLKATKVGPRALRDHVQIVMMDGAGRASMRDFGILGSKIWTTNSQSALRSMLCAGLGYALVPTHFFASDLAAGRLCHLPATESLLGLSTPSPCYLIWEGDAVLSPIAQRFAEILTEDMRIS